MTLLTNCTAIVVCCLLRYLNNDSTSYNTLIGTCINYTNTTNKQNRNIKSWNLHLFDIVMGYLFRQTLKALAMRIYKRWMEYKHFCYDDDNDRNEYDKKKWKLYLELKAFTSIFNNSTVCLIVGWNEKQPSERMKEFQWKLHLL